MVLLELSATRASETSASHAANCSTSPVRAARTSAGKTASTISASFILLSVECLMSCIRPLSLDEARACSHDFRTACWRSAHVHVWGQTSSGLPAASRKEHEAGSDPAACLGSREARVAYLPLLLDHCREVVQSLLPRRYEALRFYTPRFTPLPPRIPITTYVRKRRESGKGSRERASGAVGRALGWILRLRQVCVRL